MQTVSFNTQFPGYEILGEISRSNARVLKARHLDTGDLVAIKHFTFNTDAETLRRFGRESEIMARINHPNIVNVREVRLDAELPFIVMDLVEGGSVRQLLTGEGGETRNLSVNTTIRLGLQIIDALSVIHPQGIVHRDIKPENILFRRLASGELHFLLTDFGIARLNEQAVTVTGQSLMTYEYASPEQFDNPRQVSAATDYYSLGVVLFECLTGQVPFSMGEGIGIVTFMNTVLTTPPPRLVPTPDRPLPPSLADLLHGLLMKQAAERIHDPTVVKLALKQAELEQLQMEQGSALTGAVTTEASVLGAGSQTKPTQAHRSPVEETQPRRPAKQSAEISRPRTGQRKLVLIGLLVLLVGTGVYYAVTRNSGDKPLVSVAPNAGPKTAQVSPEQIQAEEAKRKAEEARLLEERRQQMLKAAKLVKVESAGFRTGLFGGIKELKLRLRNPTELNFRYVLVKVSYIKDNGKIFKSANVYFRNIGPYSTEVRSAPDSQRGTQVSAKVVSYESPDIPAPAEQPQP
ncbi:serine/threonine protein kinase [Spirosoma taeanense]|uniref:Serine/threonine protein kinase n=1 Tax=Spirosoma taeanense TaxID=2735870 RepID=A0A6M5Y7I5_9BACT|nr:serine/threonine-protein kinase [Spirosoma taeanense]QJW90328.1 serine/threonine protein kinase [Spirosoma taeanense]